jgi:hypothetical protein
MERAAQTDDPHGCFLGVPARIWARVWLLFSLVVLFLPTSRVMGIEFGRSGVNMLAVVDHFFSDCMVAIGLLSLLCALILLFLPRSRILWVCASLLLLAFMGVRWLAELHLTGALKGWIPS